MRHHWACFIWTIMVGLAIGAATHVHRAEAGVAIFPKKKEIYNRLALVIAVGEYAHLSIRRNSTADAYIVSEKLKELGFKVTLLENPNHQHMMSAIDSYINQLKSTKGSQRAVSVFYFVGDGVHNSGTAYIAAADARQSSDDAAPTGLVNLGTVAKRLAEATGSRDRSFLLIDAPRTAKFNQNTADPKIENHGQTYPDGSFLFSTMPNEDLAPITDRHGPFAKAVVHWLSEQMMRTEDIYRMIRLEVTNNTEGHQVPHFAAPSTGNFLFNQISDYEIASDRAGRVVYLQPRTKKELSTYEDGSFALLIGVGDYSYKDGDVQPWNDLQHVKAELDQLGEVLSRIHQFEVQTVFDPTRGELEVAMEQFVYSHGAKRNARIFIMLAGHGTTTETYQRKTAWFVPADAPGLSRPDAFRRSALNLRRIEEWSETMEAKHVMWVFDSCFSGEAIRMIESRRGERRDGWRDHLHHHPVRRVLTAGSEDEEVPAKSRFTETLTKLLSGKLELESDKSMITGAQIGTYLKKDVIQFTTKNNLPKNTPQNDTILIDGEEGDIIFRLENKLVERWTPAIFGNR